MTTTGHATPDLLHAHKRQHGTEVPFVLKTYESLAALTLGNLTDVTPVQELSGGVVGYHEGREVACVDGLKAMCAGERLPDGQMWVTVIGRYCGVRIGLDYQDLDAAETDWWRDLSSKKAEKARADHQRDRLLLPFLDHKRKHGTEVPFAVESGADCDLLTGGDLVCDGERWAAPVVGRYRGALISIGAQEVAA